MLQEVVRAVLKKVPQAPMIKAGSPKWATAIWQETLQGPQKPPGAVCLQYVNQLQFSEITQINFTVQPKQKV